MTKIVLTDEQKDAIYTRNKNIIVSAAAGSGKTKVLVDRVIALMLEEKISIKEMIIVTFTNKASVDMKNKIRKKLTDLMQESTDDREFLKEQIRSINDAYIKTLHAFCADMLRENFYMADDLSPSFKIASSSKNALLEEDSINELFEINYEKGLDSFELFLHNFASLDDDKNAKDLILKLYKFMVARVNPHDWLDYFVDHEFDYSLAKKYIKNELEKIIKEVYRVLDFTYDNFMDQKYSECIRADIDYLESLANKIYDLDWDSLIKEGGHKFKQKPSIKKDEDDPDLDKKFKDLRENYKNDFKKLFKFTINSDSITRGFFDPVEKNILKELKRLVLDFEKIYKDKKRDENYLDFADMEHEFIRLLENDDLVKKLKKDFKYIFFDEYQDSNDTQNYIVDKLKKKDNLFFVGDVKQSIYGFRNARPELFIKKLKDYENDENSLRINLSKNFRTDKDVIFFNNFIFDRLMNKEDADIDYKNDGHRLNPDKDFDIKNPKVRLNILDSDVNEDEYIVKEIENIINMGMDYKDIAILVKKNSMAPLIENELKKAGIPYASDVSKDFFQSVENDFFINILSYIKNPKDDITLLSNLRSEVFNFSEDELSLISLSSDKRYFYQKFESYEKDHDDKLSRKISDFSTIFTNFSYLLNILDLYDFANLVFEETGLYDFLKARDRGSERVKNVQAIIELMDDYDKNNSDSLFGFLSYVDKLKDQNSGDFKAARDLSDEENLVRIMTIHKSKGLEFPCVILHGAGHEFYNKKSSTDMLLDRDLGIGLKLVDWENRVKISTLRRELIDKKDKINGLKEEMRVLYVALTRAEERISIVGNVDFDKSYLEKIYQKDSYLDLNSYMDWIIKALLDDKIMKDYIDLDFKTDDFKDGLLKIDHISSIGENKKDKSGDIEEIFSDKFFSPKIYEEIKDVFDFDYKNKENINKSLKKSVTEIAKNYDLTDRGYEKSSFDEKIEDYDFRRPNFEDEEGKLKPTEKGSFIHKLFQELEVKEYDKKTLKDDIENLSELGRINKDYLKYIDYDNILYFFNSDIVKNLTSKNPNIRKEESFLKKIDNFYVNGQIDIIFEYEDQIVLMDFKTDSVKREGFYDRQLEIYKDAIEESLGKKVIKSFIYWYNFKEFEQVNKNHH